MLRKLEFHSNMASVTVTLHEEQFAFMIISRPVLLIIRIFLDKIVEKMVEHISRSISFFPKIVSFVGYRGKTS